VSEREIERKNFSVGQRGWSKEVHFYFYFFTVIDNAKANRRLKCECYGREKSIFVVYYESIKREVKRRLTYEYRCDKRLKTQNEESTRLSWSWNWNT
jgi:hypothetical protein